MSKHSRITDILKLPSLAAALLIVGCNSGRDAQSGNVGAPFPIAAGMKPLSGQLPSDGQVSRLHIPVSFFTKGLGDASERKRAVKFYSASAASMPSIRDFYLGLRNDKGWKQLSNSTLDGQYWAFQYQAQGKDVLVAGIEPVPANSGKDLLIEIASFD